MPKPTSGFEAVVEFIGMRPARCDVDAHRAAEAGQFAVARSRHDDDIQIRRTLGHRCIVLQGEAALAPVQAAADTFDRHVTARAAGAADAEHLALTRRLEIAVKLLVDRAAPETGVILVVRLKQIQLDLEGSGRARGHCGFPKESYLNTRR